MTGSASAPIITALHDIVVYPRLRFENLLSKVKV